MANSNAAGEKRNVSGFDRLELRDPTNLVDLIVYSGAEQCLLIETSQSIRRRIKSEVRDGILHISLGGTISEKLKDAVTTSLTRQHITYHLTTPFLKEIRYTGLIQINLDAYEGTRPEIKSTLPLPPLPPRMS